MIEKTDFSIRQNGFLYKTKRISLVEKTVLSGSEVRSVLPDEILVEVLAPWGQLVVLQTGQHVAQLQEEALAGRVLVGVHVEAN